MSGARNWDHLSQSLDELGVTALRIKTERDELLAALELLVDREFSYAGPDADTANPKGMYRAVWDARALIARVKAAQ